MAAQPGAPERSVYMINGKKVLGIIGGVGPMATVDFYKKVVEMTDASCDQEHIHVLIDGNSQVPDRTASILAGDERPLPYLIDSARRLEAAGADLLVVTCNAAHFFFDKLEAACSVPLLNMVVLAAREAARLGFRCTGLLAVDGTLCAGVYDRVFQEQGLRLVHPDDFGQRLVMHLIYDEVKAGAPVHPEALYPTLDDMSERGAECFILGCTELPLAFSGCRDFFFLDPSSILAREAIRALGYPIKNSAPVETEAVHVSF